MQTLKHNAEIELTEMYQSATPFLEDYPWEMEEDRWTELIVSVFCGLGIDPIISKQAADLLKRLNVLTPKDLEKLEDGQTAFIRQVLLQADMDTEEAEAAADALLKLSGWINNKWNGYIQKFLRSYGVRMIKELQTYLTRSGIESGQSKRIATVWLQNVCNLPMLLEGDPHIKNFCSKFKLTETGLIDILDELGLNACLADDLLAIHDEPNSSVNGSGRKPRAKAKKPAKSKLILKDS
jgi:hypothetical protein